MKKILLTLLVILSISRVGYAQWVNGTNLMYYTGGNVGIGTATPVAGLSVEAGPNAAMAPLTSVPNGSAWIGAANTTGGISIGQFSGTYGYIQSRNKGTGSGAYILALNPLGGNVGIGTSTPGAKLSISGGALLMDNGQWYSSKNTSGIATSMFGLSSDNNIYIGDVFGNSPASAVFFRTNGTDRILIAQNGNVGIGTGNPQNKLDVNGTIHAKEVKIDMSGWGDYVFKKDYHLRTLNEVKAFIDQNQHLPEIPSEKEIVRNGLNVSEMNKLLMKKVEELTLYIIEKDKQMSELKVRLDKLEQR